MASPALKVGYLVNLKPDLASYRLRVKVPSENLNLPYVLHDAGRPTFVYKIPNPQVVRQLQQAGRKVVYDVVNDHFDRFPPVKEVAQIADHLTCGSAVMADIVRRQVGREATVIDDPWENDESEPACEGHTALWFGHLANINSLYELGPALRRQKLVLCTNSTDKRCVPWTLQSEAQCLRECAVVLITGTNPGASSNRVVKALRAGRFPIMPAGCAQAWQQFAPFAWIGDVRDGMQWAFQNRATVCRRIVAGQEYCRERFSPERIGQQWADVFRGVGA